MNLTKKYIIIKMPPKQSQATKKGAKPSPPAKAATKKGKKDLEESKEDPAQKDREDGTVESEGDEDDEIL